MGTKSGTIPENPGQIITLTDSRTSFLFFNGKGQLDDWKLTVPTALVTERDVSCQGQRTALPLRMPPPPLLQLTVTSHSQIKKVLRLTRNANSLKVDLSEEGKSDPYIEVNNRK